MDRLKFLFEKYKNDQCSPEEMEELLDFFSMQKEKPVLEDYIYEVLEETYNDTRELDLSVNEVYENLHKNIFLEPHGTLRRIKLNPENSDSNKKSLWTRIAAAAAILLVVGVGILFYTNSVEQVAPQVGVYTNDIAPGKMGATLTLANGKKIFITDANAGVIGNQSGVKISKTVEGKIVYEITDNNASASEYNTLSTVRGQQTEVHLPDGSLVFLNAASSIRYPASFARLKERRIELSGEAYFEISKDKAHPFIVKTTKQEVEVLGTHFNINSYEDEGSVKTTLLEGSVKVTAAGESKLLKADQQAELSSGNMEIKTVDTELAVAWKNNKFIFESQQVTEIMRMVARWYNIEVIYKGKIPEDRYSGTVSRFDQVSNVLRILESSGGVHFKIEGRKIYVSP